MAFLEKNMEKDIFYIMRVVHITNEQYSMICSVHF